MSEDAVAGNSARARVGRVLAPIVLATLWLVPLPLDGKQHRLAAIAAAVVVMWVTEVVPVPVTALLIAPAMVAAGITDAKSAFAPYADPLLFLFYGSFFIALSMQRHGLDRRLAQAVVRSPMVAGVPWRTRLSLMLVGACLSMWISNTASTAMLVPILLGTMGKSALSRLSESKRSSTTVGGLLAIAYACSVGGMGTLVGTPPNMITIRLLRGADVRLGFVDWIQIGVPSAAALVAIIYLVFARLYPPPPGNAQPKPEPADDGPLSRGERVTALSFLLAVLGWLTPGVLKAVGSDLAGPVSRALPAGGVAILAASLLFLMKDADGRRAVLPWQEARTIDWGLIMLFGGGISLGTQMFQTGLANELGRGFIALTGVRDLWTLTALAMAFTIFFTEMCSNTATSNMVVPLVIGVCAELGVSPIAPSIGVALAASCAFMLPIATGPNAIVYGTGKVPMTRMLRAGFILNLVCGAALFGVLRIMCPLLGWT
ncbi:MAG: DASS family sodium-coupled anion symporter [Myxococcales bacterium]|nr:DASS family sodium-coupled anion symporter [Myxococcales bacterium]MDD9967791.1 DASS family sodium-coupled anion symporter [Myxococcales bacterium]